jgi:hypothetical protein
MIRAGSIFNISDKIASVHLIRLVAINFVSAQSDEPGCFFSIGSNIESVKSNLQTQARDDFGRSKIHQKLLN